MRTKVVLSLALGALLLGGVPVEAAKSYPNCVALNKVYPHGVGRPKAVDKVDGRFRPGRSVTNFTKNRAVYLANTARDRDGDGIACEKR